MIGKEISHYKILAKLGGGGMGVVYKAEDIRLKRLVALKFLPPELTRDSEAKKRFMQEAQAASALEHPNICTIHEIETTADDQLFMVMTYYDGTTLDNKIAKGSLSVNEAIDISIQILLGLSRAHEAGIIHRDIKPANIMITSRGEVKVLDFGLAKLSGKSRTTRKGRYMGTLAYMSPEQARGETVDHRTDIWSVGVVFYEMITGKIPFDGEYGQAIIYSIINEDPPALESIKPDLPQSIENILKRAMAKDPIKRYNYVEEFMVELVSLQKKIEKELIDNQQAVKIEPFKFRVAVLPFANFSPDPEDEYFADGLTEELISTLSKIKEFKVIARTSVMQYKKTTKSAAKIGRELKVGNILESSVRKAGKQVRISSQLINSHTEENIWSQVYDRELKDIFAIQSDIAQSIARALQIQLLNGEKQQVEKKATDNLEAYHLYLKGRYWWNKRNEEGLKKSILFFEKAIDLDPLYALAYTGIADAYIILGNYGVLAPGDAYSKAEKAAENALKIDDSLAQAHSSLGCVNSLYFWDWSKAEKHFKQAIDLNDKYATTFHWYAINFLTPRGEFDQALTQIHQAQELDPLSLIINTTVGLVHYFAGEYDQAIQQYRKTLEIDSEFAIAYLFMGWTLEQKQMKKEAIEAVERAIQISGNTTAMQSELASTLANVGEFDKAKAVSEKITQPSSYAMYSLAAYHTALGEQDEALQWLMKAYDNRTYRLIYLKVDPKFTPLYSHHKFKELVNKVGIG